MKLHRVLTILVLLVTVITPNLVAVLCQTVANFFRQEFLTHPSHIGLPGFTEFWIMQKIQFAPMAMLFSFFVLGIGIFLFRKKTEQSAVWILLLCCISFVATLLLMASVTFAATLPFIQAFTTLLGPN